MKTRLGRRVLTTKSFRRNRHRGGLLRVVVSILNFVTRVAFSVISAHDIRQPFVLKFARTS